MCLDLVNIGGESCEPVAGMVGKVHLASYKDFESIKDPKDLCCDGENIAANVEDLATISDSHTFKEGKGFVTISAIEETVAITSSLIGEKGRRLFQNVGTIVVGGSHPKTKGFLRAIKNGKYIALFEEFESGRIVQIGNSRFPAWFEGIESAIEALAEGNNSVTLTIQDKSKWPAAVYQGDITLLEPES
jgi:hypothetical protein